MRRKIRRWVAITVQVASYVGFAFSAICTFLGAAPTEIVATVIGPVWVARLLSFREGVLNMTQEQARWFFVIIGDLSFGTSLYFLFYVYFSKRLAKIYVTQTEHEAVIERMKADVQSVSDDFDDRLTEQTQRIETTTKESRQMLAEAKQRERSARRIHDMTYKLLQKVRAAKKGPSSTSEQ
ncbi:MULTISPECIES: hypothetical protein [Bradyrhizobium]|uniref:hypothetical protein n=1 Tax=Bradyrhizobium elkanii TaxID=29448 RepID=UPI00048A3E57|nr:hypothetical protein [Bradyrhizobium elkanii]